MNKEPTPYWIVSCSYTEGVNRWVEGVAKFKQNITPLVIMYEPEFEVPADFTVRKQKGGFPGMIKRFYPVVDLIKQYGVNEWYLWTDVADVIIQRPLPDLNSYQCDVLVCSENEVHSKVKFWDFIKDSRYYSGIYHKEVYNAGCFAMKGFKFLEFLEALFAVEKIMGEVSIGIDQLELNHWLLKAIMICGKLSDRITITTKANLWYTHYREQYNKAHLHGHICHQPFQHF